MLSASWYKIIALSALQGAISPIWLIYNIYPPQLLISYGFAPTLAVILIIIDNSISVILEPLFGSLSDLAFRWGNFRSCLSNKYLYTPIDRRSELLFDYEQIRR